MLISYQVLMNIKYGWQLQKMLLIIIRQVSIRSRDITINQVAAKYNGGGHALASGAKLEKIELLPDLINDLKELINEKFK